MDCLVIVDAWKNCEKEDLQKFPWMEKEIKAFGFFLNLQLQIIKNTRDIEIIHCPSGRPIMKEIDTKNSLIIQNIDEIKNRYNFYYFCGFHIGRCINTKIKNLNINNCGVVVNLSMVFPSDSYQMAFEKSIHVNNYMYSYKKGFECIDIKI